MYLNRDEFKVFAGNYDDYIEFKEMHAKSELFEEKREKETRL